MKSRIYILISGDVTGVSFRAYIKYWAEKLNLRGYAKNIENKVEAVFEGEKRNIQRMLDLCRKGPGLARISGVYSRENEFKKEFKDFRITH